MATYQDLGFIKDNVMTIISPVKKVKQFSLTLDPKAGVGEEFQLYYEQKPIEKIRQDLVNESVSYYQTASYLLKNHLYQQK